MWEMSIYRLPGLLVKKGEHYLFDGNLFFSALLLSWYKQIISPSHWHYPVGPHENPMKSLRLCYLMFSIGISFQGLFSMTHKSKHLNHLRVVLMVLVWGGWVLLQTMKAEGIQMWLTSTEHQKLRFTPKKFVKSCLKVHFNEILWFPGEVKKYMW